MWFSTLNIGYSLRKDPRPPITLGVFTALLAGGLTLAFLMTWIAFNNTTNQFINPLTTLRSWGYQPPWRFQIAFALGGAAGVVAGLAAYWHAFSHAPLREPFRQIRPDDPRVFFDDDARRELQNRFKQDAGLDIEDGLYLAPHLVMPRGVELKGLMVVGSPRSGKSNLLRAMADQMIARGDRVLLLCNKGDVTRSFLSEEAILIGAHDARSFALDFAADIAGPAAALQFATDIIPASSPPFWSDAARTVLTDIILGLIAEHGQSWDAGMLLDACLVETSSIREAISKIKLNASPFLGAEDDEDSRTVDGILITMRAAAFSKLRPLAWAWQNTPKERRFSVRRWLSSEERRKPIILQLSAEYAAVSSLVAGHVIKSIATCMADPAMGISRTRRVGLVLDEFGSLDQVEGLPRALAVGREMGLVCMIGIQNPTQIIDAYGNEKGAILSDLLQIKVYAQQPGGDTTEAISNRLGTRDVSALIYNRTPTAGDRRRLIEERKTVPTFSASRLADELKAPAKNQLRSIVHAYGQVFVLNWPVTIWRVRREGMIPAPWLKNVPLARQPAAPE